MIAPLILGSSSTTLFEVPDKRTFWFQDALEFQRDGEKPLDVLFGWNPSVSVLATVRVWRRGDDEINTFIRERSQDLATIALMNEVRFKSCYFHRFDFLPTSGVTMLLNFQDLLANRLLWTTSKIR